jgi:hypothetical protein
MGRGATPLCCDFDLRSANCLCCVCVLVALVTRHPVLDVAIQLDGPMQHFVSLDVKGYLRVWHATTYEPMMVAQRHGVVRCAVRLVFSTPLSFLRCVCGVVGWCWLSCLVLPW